MMSERDYLILSCALYHNPVDYEGGRSGEIRASSSFRFSEGIRCWLANLFYFLVSHLRSHTLMGLRYFIKQKTEGCFKLSSDEAVTSSAPQVSVLGTALFLL